MSWQILLPALTGIASAGVGVGSVVRYLRVSNRVVVPELSLEEKAAQADTVKRNTDMARVRGVALYQNAVLTRSLTQQRFVHTRRTDEQMVKRVDFLDRRGGCLRIPVLFIRMFGFGKRRGLMEVVQVNTIYYNIESIYFLLSGEGVKPHGVTYSRLMRGCRARTRPDGSTEYTGNDVLTNLAIDMNTSNLAFVSHRNFFALRFSLAASRHGVPAHVDWHKYGTNRHMMYGLHRDGFDPLRFAVGVGFDDRHFYHTLGEKGDPHLLIVGSTGKGKSVFLNQMLITLLINNTSETLKVVLVDLKEVELHPYRNIPHLLMPTVTEKEQFVPTVEKLMHMMKERQAVVKSAGHSNLYDYNRAMPKHKRMPRIMLVIDELAFAMLGKGMGARTELLASFAMTGRAMGFHLVVCTQVNKREVFPTLLAAQIVNRISTSATATASRMALDSILASRLGGIKGRIVLYVDGERYIVQAPFISRTQIRNAIKEIIAREKGKDSGMSSFVSTVPTLDSNRMSHDELTVMRIAYQVGTTVNRTLKPLLKGHVGGNRLVKILNKYTYDAESKTPVFTLDGLPCILFNVEGGRYKQRFVVPIGDNPPPTQQEAEQYYYDMTEGSPHLSKQEAQRETAPALTDGQQNEKQDHDTVTAHELGGLDTVNNEVVTTDDDVTTSPQRAVIETA